VIETDYDAGGRPLHRRVTTVGSGLDGAVRRISTAYLARGMVDTVTQYTSATVGGGAATDQVRFTFDGWGNLAAFEQDVDGVIGAGGREAFAVAYTWSKFSPSGGAVVLAREDMTYPDGSVLKYVYSGTINEPLTRVSALTFGPYDVQVASYQYLGAGQLVKTTLDEPDVSTALWHGARQAGSLPHRRRGGSTARASLRDAGEEEKGRRR
jgi:hypothetical protein